MTDTSAGSNEVVVSASDSPGTCLVTGGAGFVGSWLIRRLIELGWTVTAAATDRASADAACLLTEGVEWVFGDMRDPDHIAECVRKSRPDQVFHLAAISHLPTAAADPGRAWDVNVVAGVRLFSVLAEELRAGTLNPRVLVVGSAEQYGHQLHIPPSGILETAPQLARTVYAATKAAQEVAALQAFRYSGLPVVLVRPFNHSGPGQQTSFLLPALVSRAKRLTEGQELRMGNTTPIRDFLHVSDVVEAYIAISRHGIAGEAYNISSGIGRSVQEVAERILERVGCKSVPVEDPSLVRPVDVPVLVGDSSRVRAATGWKPQHTFDDLLDDLLNAATY